MNSTLIETLTEQTQSLRTQYLAKMSEYAASEYERIEKIAATPHPDWSAIVTNKDWHSCEGAEQRKRYHKMVDARHRAENIVEAGFEKFNQKMIALAERHYTDSIIKLAARIEKKGLDQETIEIKTAHVDVNIETTLTDATGKRVRAWTIIASGPCVRPHYRYLVK